MPICMTCRSTRKHTPGLICIDSPPDKRKPPEQRRIPVAKPKKKEGTKRK